MTFPLAVPKAFDAGAAGFEGVGGGGGTTIKEWTGTDQYTDPTGTS